MCECVLLSICVSRELIYVMFYVSYNWLSVQNYDKDKLITIVKKIRYLYMYVQIHTSPASTVNHSFIVLNEKHCLCSSFPLSFDMLPLQFIVPMFDQTIKSNKKIRFLQRLKSFTELFTTFRFQWINQRFDKTKRMKPSIKRRRIKTMRAYIKISTKRYNNKKNSTDLISVPCCHAHHEELFFSKTFYQMHY